LVNNFHEKTISNTENISRGGVAPIQSECEISELTVALAVFFITAIAPLHTA